MKLTFVILLTAVLQTIAGISYSQSTSLSISLKNAPVQTVLRQIEEQSEFYFLYSRSVVDVDRTVDLQLKNAKIKEVLDVLFNGTEVAYKVDGRQIVLSQKLDSSISEVQQQKNISGSVTDSNGSPIPGVSVVLKGTSKGTITDSEGKFALANVADDAILVFSFVGMKTQEIPVSGQTAINVTMVEDYVGVDEVVVIGYGVQKKSDITGSITSVDVEKLRDVPSANLTKALQGKTAGVEITNIGNRPGSSSQIRIRGSRSLSASNDPLVVVDGIPFGGSISDIASDDIASIEVLKDASATVIYGSRGSNGVIIITTKKGKTGALKVGYNGYFGLTNVAREYNLMNAEDFIKLRTAANYTNYLPDEKESMLLGRETDWQNLIYKTAQTSNHEINLSAGTENTQYSLSGGYYSEDGVLPGMDYSRYTLRFALDQKIGKYIQIGLTTMNSLAYTDGQSANPMFAIMSLSPLSVPYKADGTLNKQPGYDTELTYNPLTLLDKSSWKEQNRRNATFNTLYAQVDILDGLKYRANLGYDFSTNKYNNFYGSATQFKQGSASTAVVSNTDNSAYTIENLLMYDKTFGAHHIGFTAMQSMQESTSIGSSFQGTNIAADYLQYNNLALASVVNASSNGNYYSKWSLVSFMGRLNYSFHDRYLVTLTGRSDGSSRLAEEKKWHAYPAVALGWKISQEPFMKYVSVISNLKLRAGYGQTSNTSINPYTTLGGLSNTKYDFGSTGVNGYYVSTLPNTELTWEYTSQTNLGLDFGVLNDRINGSVDMYLQKTDGVLLGVSLPPSQGVPGSFLKNIGKTENKGLEISLNGLIIKPRNTNNLSWEVNANVFFNREKIVALQEASIKQDIGNGWFVGYPASAIYDYEKIGIWQLGEEVDAAVYSAKPGDLKIKDQITVDTDSDGTADAADNKIDDKDRKVLGSSQPKLLGGFTSTWEYKGFDLSVVGFFRVGGTIISTLHMPNAYYNRLDGRRNQIVVDYWTPENPTNDMPAPNVNIDASRTNVLGYFDGSFLKIRSINLGYNVDPKHTKFIGPGAKVRIYSSVTDPFIFFSPYIKKGGLDPEPTNAASADNNALAMPSRSLVVGLGTPPVIKFIFGINVKF